MKRIVYISPTGMTEALGKSQVLEYLIDLAKTHQITLFSFERAHDQAAISELKQYIKAHNIHWIMHPYSNRFGLLSIGWMLLTAICRLLGAVHEIKPHIIHTRSFVATVLGWPLAKFCRAKLLFDIRGFAMDEKLDCGRLKKKSLLYKVLHGLEVFLYRHADHLVVLTHVSKDILCQELALPEAKISVIPTCANSHLFYPMNTRLRQKTRQDLGFKPYQKILLHSGVVNRYDFDKEIQLFAELYSHNQNFHFLILNKGEESLIRAILRHHQIPVSAYTINIAPFNEMVRWLNIADAAIFFPKPTYATQAMAPTKFAEIIACHVPCITSSDVGDMAYYIKQYPVGISLNLSEFQDKITLYVQEVLKLLSKPIDKKVYDSLFQAHFDKVLAIKRYSEIYKHLC